LALGKCLNVRENSENYFHVFQASGERGENNSKEVNYIFFSLLFSINERKQENITKTELPRERGKGNFVVSNRAKKK
jgi:hypothetical protein